QVVGLGAARLFQVAVEHLQGRFGLVVLGAELGQHQHRLEVVVVVQRVQLDRLAGVALGALHVVQVVGGMGGHVGGIGLVVVVGPRLLQDVLGLFDHAGVVVILHRAVEAVQALGHPRRCTFAGRSAAGVGIALLHFLRGATPAAALAFIRLGR